MIFARSALRRHSSCSFFLARALSVNGEDRLIFRTFIGEPSDSNCSSYFLPFPSIALQEMLETCLVAKLPSCLHIPADNSTNGTGRPSTLGLCLEFSSIRSIRSSESLSCSRRRC